MIRLIERAYKAYMRLIPHLHSTMIRLIEMDAFKSCLPQVLIYIPQ